MIDPVLISAAHRYRACGMTAWQFARGKLRRDPVYRAILKGPWLWRGGTVLDVGCGQGLMLAAIAEATKMGFGKSAGANATPLRLVGIETRPKVAAIARSALGSDAQIVETDARREKLPGARTILFFDVLHMMVRVDQEALLRTVVAALEPGGVLLVRDVDAAAGWRFKIVNLANRLKALAFGYSSRTFHFRTAADWLAVLEQQGLKVSVRPMGEGTPFGNVLFCATKPA